MIKYVLKNNCIVAYKKYDNDNNITESMLVGDVEFEDNEYTQTEKDIKAYNGTYILYANDVELAEAMAEQDKVQQAIAEQEELKPTVEDLAEALDILTNIVLGGEE